MEDSRAWCGGNGIGSALERQEARGLIGHGGWLLVGLLYFLPEQFSDALVLSLRELSTLEGAPFLEGAPLPLFLRSFCTAPTLALPSLMIASLSAILSVCTKLRGLGRVHPAQNCALKISAENRDLSFKYRSVVVVRCCVNLKTNPAFL